MFSQSQVNPRVTTTTTTTTATTTAATATTNPGNDGAVPTKSNHIAIVNIKIIKDSGDCKNKHNEAEEQRQQNKSKQTQDEIKQELQKQRGSCHKNKSNQREEHRKQTLQKRRENYQRNKCNCTEEQRQQMLQKRRENYRKNKSNQTEEWRQRILQKQRENYYKNKRIQTVEQREQALEKRRKNYENKRKTSIYSLQTHILNQVATETGSVTVQGAVAYDKVQHNMEFIKTELEPEPDRESYLTCACDQNELSGVKEDEDPLLLKCPFIKTENEYEDCIQQHNMEFIKTELEPEPDGESYLTCACDQNELTGVKDDEDPLLLKCPLMNPENKSCVQEGSGSHSETCVASSHVDSEVICIKVEDVTDMKMEEDTLQVAEYQTALNEQEGLQFEGSRYSCDVCHKPFSLRCELRKHLLIHTGERPYSCSICKKSFSDQGNMKRHQRIHSGERPYSCDVCKKSFSDRGNMKRHERIHSGERPYSCNVCSASFNRESDLERHQSIHTGERPYSCNVCNKSFRQQSHLKKHQQMHNGQHLYCIYPNARRL